MNWVNLYKTAFFLPVKSTKLLESITSKVDGINIDSSIVNLPVSDSLDYCKKEFGELKEIAIPKKYYFNNMKKIKIDKSINLDLLFYVPFIENENLYVMILFLSKYQAQGVEHNLRYIYKLDTDMGLRFCDSYESACLVLLSYFKILQQA